MAGVNDISLEQLMERLENTVEQLQKEDVTLEESFKLYKQGIDDVKLCNEIIDKVEKKVLMLDQEGNLDELGN